MSQVLACHQTAGGIMLLACHGDLCSEKTNAVVNAANERLEHIGGVAKAIVKAGGEAIQTESTKWVDQHGPCATGKGAAVTGAGRLPCQQVIHVAGPVWSKRIGEETEVLGRVNWWDGTDGIAVANNGSSQINVAFRFSKLAPGFTPKAGDEVRIFVDLRKQAWRGKECTARFVTGVPPNFIAKESDEELLEGAVKAALRAADSREMLSVAMPAISSGIFGFPVDKCADIQVKCALELCQTAKNLKQIKFTNHDAPTVDAFVKAFRIIFGPSAVMKSGSKMSSATQQVDSIQPEEPPARLTHERKNETAVGLLLTRDSQHRAQGGENAPRLCCCLPMRKRKVETRQRSAVNTKEDNGAPWNASSSWYGKEAGGNDPGVCALAGCELPVFVEGGRVHQYCGWTHAQLAQQQQVHRYFQPWDEDWKSDLTKRQNNSRPINAAAFDPTKVYEVGNYIFFWEPPAVFCQWTPSDFEVDGVMYDCMEMYMMAEKARLFGDQAVWQQIISTRGDPKQVKALGRQVRNFDRVVWDAHCMDIVIKGNLAKFTQNPTMKQALLETGDKVLAEASPYDTVWGIGLRADDPACRNKATWRGSNKLGQALMIVRSKLALCAGSTSAGPAALGPRGGTVPPVRSRTRGPESAPPPHCTSSTLSWRSSSRHSSTSSSSGRAWAAWARCKGREQPESLW